MIYFDNAATSFPKPQNVQLAVSEAVRVYGGNPGRSGHRLSMQAAEKVFDVRQKAADFFDAEPENVIFTLNCTMALNMAAKGLLNKGGHVIHPRCPRRTSAGSARTARRRAGTGPSAAAGCAGQADRAAIFDCGSFGRSGTDTFQFPQVHLSGHPCNFLHGRFQCYRNHSSDTGIGCALSGKGTAFFGGCGITSAGGDLHFGAVCIAPGLLIAFWEQSSRARCGFLRLPSMIPDR